MHVTATRIKFDVTPPGGVDPARLLRQRRLGDVPVVRGSRTRHPHWPTATTQVFRGHVQTRVEGGLFDCAGATRLRQCGARTRTRPNKVPTSGAKMKTHSFTFIEIIII